ncbi:uncharacterized protein LOC132913557 [Bombus pascuorum]|uniref:uncharacterized protein LOC132913557 n=1 Tax=Bombus pascuorum TaxID=65598 RepID=UPI00298E9514|nr:uncharacterized protein LOC132913557 [Bombus pascuorum]
MADKGDRGRDSPVQGTDQDERRRRSETPLYQMFPKEKAKFTAQEALNLRPLEYQRPLTRSDIMLKNINPDVDPRTQSPLKMFFDEDPNYRPPCSSQPESETESEFESRHGSRSQPQSQPQPQYPYPRQSQPQSQYPSSYQPGHPSDGPSRKVKFSPGTFKERPLSVPQDPPVVIYET